MREPPASWGESFFSRSLLKKRAEEMMVQAAINFLTSLSDEQKGVAHYSFGDSLSSATTVTWSHSETSGLEALK
ncbi:hypothetical protein MYX84_07300 [Acidobacteria bacterium AH-259-O06]|nr:hypothetical protein [Acidobacteria bacterium AH-259-O06]